MQASKCLELRIPADDMTKQAFETLLDTLNAIGAAEETNADTAFTERVGWFQLSDNEKLLRAKISAAVLVYGVASDHIILLTLQQQDWETAWQKDWQAIPVGKNLWVRPSFCAAPTDGRIDIVLDPGMAFGTGPIRPPSSALNRLNVHVQKKYRLPCSIWGQAPACWPLPH
jgi:ribosomal protein L11 methyltransferase